MYNENQLMHSWAIKESREIASLLQIPIAKINTDLELEILEPINKVRPVLTMAVVSKSTNTYRFLSGSDLRTCMETRDTLICQKRNIIIDTRKGCVLKEANCKNWADLVVHEVTNSQILVSAGEAINPTLACGKKLDPIEIPNEAILTVPVSCGLYAERFRVGKLHFAHLADISSKLRSIGKSDLTLELHTFQISPVKEMNVTQKNATINFAQLKKENKQFTKTFMAYDARHEKMWSAISGGPTGWEQLMYYILFGVLGLFTISSHCWLFKLQISSWWRGGDGGQDALTKEQITGIKTRMADLETDLEIMNIQRRAKAESALPPK